MIHTGDAIEVMRGMDADSVDAVVTDPPYNLSFMGKGWDRFREPSERDRSPGAAHNGTTFLASRGLPESYVAGHPFQAWCEAWGREALRVTKPGGYLLAFGGTRTHHRLVCGLEDAGWIIRDELTWIYASGFPKGKANLKPAHEPIVLARKPGPLRPLNIEETRIGSGADKDDERWYSWQRGESVLQEAKGMNTPGRVAPRPIQTLVREHGKVCPGWNADESVREAQRDNGATCSACGAVLLAKASNETAKLGRWPSNLLLSDPALFDEPNPEVVGSGATARSAGDYPSESATSGLFRDLSQGQLYGDSGGYSRFFKIPGGAEGSPASMTSSDASLEAPGRVSGERSSVIQERPPSGPPDPADPIHEPECDEDRDRPCRCGYPRYFIVPKSSRADREPVIRGAHTPTGNNDRPGSAHQGQSAAPPPRANTHPTTKPTDLMAHLIRLVCPPDGTILDPFLGSGSTAVAAEREGVKWIGIEQDATYVEIANARLNGVQRGMGLDVEASSRRSTRPTTEKRAPIVRVDLELFPGMAGPAESDEVA